MGRALARSFARSVDLCLGVPQSRYYRRIAAVSVFCFGGKMRLAVWICLLALFSGLVFAQDISGTIGGTILDPTGAAVPNAKITVTNTERSQVVRTITTDATGTYSAPLISVGTYSVRVEA